MDFSILGASSGKMGLYGGTGGAVQGKGTILRVLSWSALLCLSAEEYMESEQLQRVTKSPEGGETASLERCRELNLLGPSGRWRGSFICSHKNCQGRETLKKVLKSS